ncbi:MAG: hypothetical protein N2385_14610, partial [Chloroflexus sp.]|nr:hypothetical protein [Chloroflexus sp.]
MTMSSAPAARAQGGGPPATGCESVSFGWAWNTEYIPANPGATYDIWWRVTDLAGGAALVAEAGTTFYSLGWPDGLHLWYGPLTVSGLTKIWGYRIG